MTVTRDQAQMLTTLAIACRPNGARRWDTAGVMAALAKLADRSLPEVVMATIRAASDRAVESPGVIPGPGSHWAEAAAVRPFVPDSAPAGTRCTVCGQVADALHQGHAYRPPQPPMPGDVLHERVAALKAELAPTSGPTERKGLEDMAAANPELRARVQALRDANPGLLVPPLQQPPDPAEVTTETEPGGGGGRERERQEDA